MGGGGPGGGVVVAGAGDGELHADAYSRALVTAHAAETERRVRMG